MSKIFITGVSGIGKTEIENWFDVPGCPRYQASNKGNVRSFILGKPKLLSLILKKDYYSVRINYLGKRKWLKRSQVIAMTFHNHKPCGHLIEVDHKDGNKLNDHPDNLKLVTGRQNTHNIKRKNKTSKYIGVTQRKSGTWRAHIYDGKLKALGTFKTELEAHRAYRKALRKIIKTQNHE